MMIRNNFKKILIVIFFLLLIGIVGYGVYLYTNKPETIKSIITGEKIAEDDVKNGIYSYEKKLSKSYRVFDGCNVYAINNYLVVIGDSYKYYESSCMRTSLIKNGKTEELKFNLNSKNKYEVEFDNKKFQKDNKISSIEIHTNLANYLRSSSLDTIEFIIAETEKEGSYYDFEVGISGSGKDFKYYFEYLEATKKFKIEIASPFRVLYTKEVNDLKDLPKLYNVGENIAIVDQIHNDGKYSYTLNIYNDSESIYSLSQQLPLIVNGVTLGTYNSIFLKANAKNGFDVLIGYDDKFCDENKKDGIAFYEFKIAYDYKKATYTAPEFVKIGYYKDGCSYVNKILKG